jgi:two-component system chemotaxis sensor kinase CheA
MANTTKQRRRVSGNLILAGVILIGFTIIVTGLILSGRQTTDILNLTNRITALRQEASRLNGLSKDLLFTDNLFKTWEDWSRSRANLDLGIQEVLSNPVTMSTLSATDGKTQIAYTQKIMELLKPRLDRIQETMMTVMKTNSAFSQGLLLLQTESGALIEEDQVREVRNFSLYFGDLLNLRLESLSKAVAKSALATIAQNAVVLTSTSAVILVIILLVLRTLALAQLANRRNTEYIEGVLQAVFDISGQGFLTFDQSLRVEPANSRQSSQLLGKDPSNAQVAELLWDSRVDQQDFKDGMALIFSGKSRPEVVFDLIEKEVHRGNLWLRIGFRALPNQRIMLALTDVSREHALRELQEAEEQRRTIILKAVGRPHYFAAFVKDAQKLFQEFAQRESAVKQFKDLDGLIRDIHSFKGNASFFGFRQSARAAHDTEYHLMDFRVLGGELNLKDLATTIKNAYQEELKSITDFLGESWLDTLDSVTIPYHTYLTLERYIKRNYGNDRQLVAHLASHRRQPLRELFARYPDMVETLAEQMGKVINPVIIEGGDFPVLPERYDPLMSVLVHLIRNMVDHGIETPAEREALGKPHAGTIHIRLDRQKEAHMISLGDDGRGIDRRLIEQKAKELNTLKEPSLASDEELLNLIFVDGFSTAQEITVVSGRGIGMGAVKSVVETLGGTLTIQTRVGHGTEFDIVIPTKKENNL